MKILHTTITLLLLICIENYYIDPRSNILMPGRAKFKKIHTQSKFIRNCHGSQEAAQLCNCPVSSNK